MRVPPEIQTLLKEGASLSANEAEALERSLEQRPDDIVARARLLGYYDARGKDVFRATTMKGTIVFQPENTSRRAVLVAHAVWLATNAPRAPFAAHRLLQFPASAPVYAELSSIWRRQIATDPPDSTVFANAIAFFWSSNEIFAGELLGRAEELFPGDRRWPDFRRRRRADELELAFQFKPLRNRSFPGGKADNRVTAPPSKERLDEVEQLLREGDPESEWAPRVHEIAAELSFALDRIEKARLHAEQMLVSTDDPERGYSDAVHNGHLLLGRIAVHENDLERAKAELTLAGQAGATRMVPVFGPDMRLAAELLARGEREVVIRYLSSCRSFWGRGPIDDWVATIHAGRIPDFGRNLKTE
jgi:hypothetical protein